MTEFRTFNNHTCKRVLNLLETGNQRFRQVVVKRITVIELGVNDRGDSGISCGGIKVRMDIMKLSSVITTSFGDGRNLICTDKMFHMSRWAVSFAALYVCNVQ